MSAIWLPILFAVFLWWFSTGAVLLADRMKRISSSNALLAASLLSVAAIAALLMTRDDATAAGAYVGFTAGLVLWGWHEVSFLSGVITGPRRGDCPTPARGWRRFIYAAQTLIHHEIAIAITVLALGIFFLGSANPIGFWTFTILWIMRLSAKMNIFFGVPNVTEEFLPARLTYLKTYFRKAPMNTFFPVSITLGTALTFWLFHGALLPEATPYETASYALLATLAGLAIVEHWFLVLPLRDAALWRWYLGKNEPTARLSHGTGMMDSPPSSAGPVGAGPVGVTTVLRRHPHGL